MVICGFVFFWPRRSVVCAHMPWGEGGGVVDTRVLVCRKYSLTLQLLTAQRRLLFILFVGPLHVCRTPTSKSALSLALLVFFRCCLPPPCCSKHVLDEAERSLHDALCVLTQTVKETRTVPGGGCTEIAMAAAIDAEVSPLMT